MANARIRAWRQSAADGDMSAWDAEALIVEEELRLDAIATRHAANVARMTEQYGRLPWILTIDTSREAWQERF
jgi:hypothetical protein